MRADKVCHSRQIGIVSNPNSQEGAYNCTRALEDKACAPSFYYDGHNGLLGRGVKDVRGGEKLKSNVAKWEKGQTVTVLLDLDVGKMTFWLEKNKLGSMDVKKGPTYYPAFCTCTHLGRVDFRLISS